MSHREKYEKARRVARTLPLSGSLRASELFSALEQHGYTYNAYLGLWMRRNKEQGK